MSIFGEVEIPYSDMPTVVQAQTAEQYFRNEKFFSGTGSGRDSTRGVTVPIRMRAEHERQSPPGYSGPPNGPVQVQLLPGFRYYRRNPATGTDTFEGTIACHPDEAVQIVATGAGSYP
jgi:hypothetical protein